MDKKEKQLKFSKKVKFSHIANGSSCGQASPTTSWCINAYKSKLPISFGVGLNVPEN